MQDARTSAAQALRAADGATTQLGKALAQSEEYGAESAEYAAQLKSHGEEHQARLAKVHAQHDELVSATVQKAEMEKREALAALTKAHTVEIDYQQMEADVVAQELEKTLKAKFEMESATHEGQLSGLNQEHHVALAETRAEHEALILAAVQRAEADNQEVAAALRDVHSAEIERLRAESDGMTAELEQTSATRSTEHEGQLRTLEEARDVQLQASVEEHQRADQLQQLNGQIMSRLKESKAKEAAAEALAMVQTEQLAAMRAREESLEAGDHVDHDHDNHDHCATFGADMIMIATVVLTVADHCCSGYAERANLPDLELCNEAIWERQQQLTRNRAEYHTALLDSQVAVASALSC